MFSVGLVLDPLTLELARELGPEIAEHCFTRQGKVRREMKGVKVRLRDKTQAIAARMAVDTTDPHCILRHVRVPTLDITTPGPDDDDAPVLRLKCTINCLVDPAEKTHRDFLCGFFGDFMLFTFEPEQQDLFAERRAAKAAMLPPPDPDAGDVLDEQKKGKRGRRQKGVH